MLLEILFAFWGLDYIFWVDEQGCYHRGAFYWAYALAYIGGMLFFTALLLSESTESRPKMAFLRRMGRIRELHSTGMTGAVDNSMVLRITCRELRQKTDALTHLLNRSSYESRLAALREHAVIYYFDVDEFKSINDTYGHGEGDSMLSEVGGVIYASFSHASCAVSLSFRL